jgi:hypothetical protein
MTAKTNMLVTLSAGVFLAGSACAELTYTETAEPTGGWVISINGKNYLLVEQEQKLLALFEAVTKQNGKKELKQLCNFTPVLVYY